MKIIDVEILPDDVKEELLDFYEYLVNKYVKSKGESKSGKKRIFFESVKKHSFALPEDYKFNREELYER